MTEDIDLTALTTDQIHALINRDKELLDFVKRRAEAFNGELHRRFGPQIEGNLEDRGGFGTVHFDSGNVKVTGVATKEVKWDSNLLMEIAGTMDWEKAQKFFKITFKVSEANYQAVVDDDLKDRLDKARTTFPRPLKITLEATET